jgi:hypothetical protein
VRLPLAFIGAGCGRDAHHHDGQDERFEQGETPVNKKGSREYKLFYVCRGRFLAY